MKQALNWVYSRWNAFVLVLLRLNKEDQTGETEDGKDRSIERIYYNVGGRNYSGYIYKGRILKLSGQMSAPINPDDWQ